MLRALSGLGPWTHEACRASGADKLFSIQTGTNRGRGGAQSSPFGGGNSGERADINKETQCTACDGENIVHKVSRACRGSGIGVQARAGRATRRQNKKPRDPKWAVLWRCWKKPFSGAAAQFCPSANNFTWSPAGSREGELWCLIR